MSQREYPYWRAAECLYIFLRLSTTFAPKFTHSGLKYEVQHLPGGKVLRFRLESAIFYKIGHIYLLPTNAMRLTCTVPERRVIFVPDADKVFGTSILPAMVAHLYPIRRLIPRRWGGFAGSFIGKNDEQ